MTVSTGHGGYLCVLLAWDLFCGFTLYPITLGCVNSVCTSLSSQEGWTLSKAPSKTLCVAVYGVFKKTPEFFFIRRIVVTCEPCNRFTSSFVLLSSYINNNKTWSLVSNSSLSKIFALGSLEKPEVQKLYFIPPRIIFIEVH